MTGETLKPQEVDEKEYQTAVLILVAASLLKAHEIQQESGRTTVEEVVD